MEFVTTRKGGRCGRRLLLDGYIYSIDKQRHNIIYWRCVQRSVCNGRLKTVNDLLHGSAALHQHLPDFHLIENIKAQLSSQYSIWSLIESINVWIYTSVCRVGESVVWTFDLNSADSNFNSSFLVVGSLKLRLKFRLKLSNYPLW